MRTSTMESQARGGESTWKGKDLKPLDELTPTPGLVAHEVQTWFVSVLPVQTAKILSSQCANMTTVQVCTK